MVSFTIFIASVRNILDTPSYLFTRYIIESINCAYVPSINFVLNKALI
jgi:hypothetical protein